MSAPEDPELTGVLKDWSEYRFEISQFASTKATSFQSRRVNITELAIMLQDTTASGATTDEAKHRLPLIKLAIFGRKKSRVITDPQTGRRKGGSLRHDGNLIALTGIEADYDGEIIPVDVAVELVTKAGILAIVTTSPSHTPEKPRWRIFCPFSREIRGQEHGESTDRLHPKRDMYLNWLNGLFQPNGCFGGESWTLSQIYFIGSANDNPEHRVEIIDGTPIDLLPHLELTRIGKPATGAPKPRLAARGGQFVPHPTETGEAPLMDDEAVRELILRGESIHPSMVRLTGKWMAEGVGLKQAWALLEKLLDECTEELKATPRWQERQAQIPEIIEWVFGKEAFKKEQKKRERAERKAERKAAQDRASETEAQEPTPVEPATIEVFSGMRHIHAQQGLRALRTAKVQFFQRNKGLVRVVGIKAKDADGRDILVPGIVAVTPPIMARALGQSARWEKTTVRDGTKRIDPPREVVDQIVSMVGDWPFDALKGIIGTATMRPDCSLLTTPGFDDQTGLYLFDPPPMPPIPERPTKREALAALELLAALLAEFPFQDNTSRSVGMSMLMTPVLRGALTPAVPMHVLTAPTPGTGKSYLQDTAAAIALGERCPVIAAAPREEETEKRLVTAALSGGAIIAIDNCNGVLTGDFLAQATERALMVLRPLGGSDQVRVENSFSVFANGNNIIIAADLARRAVRCVLDANTDDPGKRVFLGDPVRTVLADRGKYVAAILTIARAYHIAGEPPPPAQMHSYERWSTLVCGALVWLGWDNPMDTIADLKAEDPVGQQVQMVLAAFPNFLTEYTSQQLIDAATDKDSYNQLINPAWNEAVMLVARDRKGNIDVLRLGYWLRQHKGKMAGDLKLERTGSPTRPRWRVIRL